MNTGTISLPFLAYFHDHGFYQAQAKSGIGKWDRDSRTTSNITAELFQTIIPPKAATMFFRKRENGQLLGNVLFHPVSQVGSCFGIVLNHQRPNSLVSLRWRALKTAQLSAAMNGDLPPSHIILMKERYTVSSS